jgi:hypothetical protein
LSLRWEYASVSWAFYRPLAESELKNLQWTKEITISRPGREKESRIEWTEGSGDTGADLSAAFGELGAEGWELVSETVRDVGLSGDYFGWSTASRPISVFARFKRPAQD